MNTASDMQKGGDHHPSGALSKKEQKSSVVIGWAAVLSEGGDAREVQKDGSQMSITLKDTPEKDRKCHPLNYFLPWIISTCQYQRC